MMSNIYIDSNLKPLTKITSSSKKYPPMKHLLNDHKDCPNQHKNSLKLRNEMWHLVLTLAKSQWKLRQHDQNFPIEESHCRTNTSVRTKKKTNLKEQDCESHGQGSK